MKSEHASRQPLRSRQNGPSQPQRLVAEATEQSGQQIDRYERAFSAFWREAGDNERLPATRLLMQPSLEFASWTARRAHAYTEAPARMMHCATPQQAMAEHGQFVKNMMRDYQILASNMIDFYMQPLTERGEQRH